MDGLRGCGSAISKHFGASSFKYNPTKFSGKKIHEIEKVPPNFNKKNHFSFGLTNVSMGSVF